MFSPNNPIDPEAEASYEEPWSCCQCGGAVYAHNEVISNNMSFCSHACAEEYNVARAEELDFKEKEPEF